METLKFYGVVTEYQIQSWYKLYQVTADPDHRCVFVKRLPELARKRKSY